MSSTKSRLLPGRYPEPETDPIADQIRKRRGERGLTALDANLLHFPAGARGYNDLLGALRTGGKLPGNLRELMILRVAALNHAAYEWIQHEPIGRTEGLTTGQLYAIRDIDTPLPPMKGLFTPLLETGLEFVDALTLVDSSSFSVELGLRYKAALRTWVDDKFSAEELTDELYAESTMLVATYNLVSRFLIGTDVKGLADSDVPWPLERTEQLVSLPSYPDTDNTARHSIFTITLRHQESKDEDIPWIVLSNSLLTSTRMWGWVVPFLLDGGLPGSEKRRRYNILLHDQRGHGRSTLPPALNPTLGYGDDDSTRRTTIPLLAWDVQNLLVSEGVKRIIDGEDSQLAPVHAIIGVSQGGACALAFGAAYPLATSDAVRRAKGVVACDTSARTPAGNRNAWKERVSLVLGGTSDVEYGQKIGLSRLADVTIPRWFPSGSALLEARNTVVRDMVENTDAAGFVEGARALGTYDLLEGSSDIPPLFESKIDNVLLLAGSLDGNGKVGDGLQALKTKWGSSKIGFERIEGAGHLPMIDQPEEWCEVVEKWLSSF